MWLLLLLLIPFTALAGFPPNNLDREDGLHFTTMTEQTFNSIIDNYVKIYSPIVASHGAQLVVNKLWTNPTVNANASKQGNKWVLNMYGGLARRPEITPDGFALVLCHESGHLLAGFPFYSGQEMAVEGQSDYESTHSCAKEIWKNERITRIQPRNELCDTRWSSQVYRGICSRSLEGGQSLANLLAVISGQPMPSPETPDTSVVSRTYQSHPKAQSRLDSYIAGAICRRDFDIKVMPKTQAEAFKYSCPTGTIGERPRSWFKPK